MNSVVLGLEGDFSAASISGDASGTFGGTAVTGNARHLWLATLAGRFGVAHGRTLPYLKAGGAWTAYKWNYLSAGGGTASNSNTRSGYLVGAGVEQAVTDLISVKLEYNYMNFGNATETLSTTGGLAAAPTAVRMDMHALKLGVNLRLQSIP